MDDLVKRLREPLTAGMFLNLSALVEELQRQREEAANRIEADAARIEGLIAAAEARNALLGDQAQLIAHLAQDARAANARVKVLEAALLEIADCETYDRHNGEFVPTEEAYIARAALEGEK